MSEYIYYRNLTKDIIKKYQAVRLLDRERDKERPETEKAHAEAQRARRGDN